MRSLPLLLLLSSSAAADNHAARRDIATAIAKRDVVAVDRATAFPLKIDRLWFDTESCKQFEGKREVASDQLPALVDCLAGLDITASDTGVTYGPGVPVWIVVDGSGKMRMLVGIRLPSFGDRLVIAPDVFAKHVTGFQRQITPDAATKKQLDADDGVASMMALVCVDGRGKVTSVDVDKSTHATYAATVEKAVRRWKIKPFAVRGKAMAACSAMLLGYPEDKLGALAFPPPPPPPPPPATTTPPADPSTPAPTNVAPTVLEGQRISGEKNVVPDDLTKVAIQQKKVTKIIGSWKLCIDDKGVVKTVKNLKPTGFADYDAKIEREMWKWKYRPYLVNGKAANVCTAVTYIYTQAPAEKKN